MNFLDLPLPQLLEKISLDKKEEWDYLEYLYKEAVINYKLSIGDNIGKTTITGSVFNKNQDSSTNFYSTDGLLWLSKTLCKHKTKNIALYEKLFNKINKNYHYHIDTNKIMEQLLDYSMNEIIEMSPFIKNMIEKQNKCFVKHIHSLNGLKSAITLIDIIDFYIKKEENFDSVNFISKLNKKTKNDFLANILLKYACHHDKSFDEMFVNMLELCSEDDFKNIKDQYDNVKTAINDIWMKEIIKGDKSEYCNFYLLSLLKKRGLLPDNLPTAGELQSGHLSINDYGIHYNSLGNKHIEYIKDINSLVFLYLLLSADKVRNSHHPGYLSSNRNAISDVNPQYMEESISFIKEKRHLDFLFSIEGERENFLYTIKNNVPATVLLSDKRLPAYTWYLLGKEYGVEIFKGAVEKDGGIMSYLQTLLSSKDTSYIEHTGKYMEKLFTIEGFSDLYDKWMDMYTKSNRKQDNGGVKAFVKYIKPYFKNKQLNEVIGRNNNNFEINNLDKKEKILKIKRKM